MSARSGMTLALLSVVLALAPEAGCQETSPPLPLGSRVRVTVESGAEAETWRPLTVREGSLTGWDGTVIELDGDAGAFSIPLARAAKLEVSRGRKGHALTGALIGAGVGVALTTALLISSTDDSEFTGGMAVVLGSVLFVLPGTGIGAGIGALIRTDRWESVPLPERPGTIAPAVTVRVPVGP